MTTDSDFARLDDAVNDRREDSNQRDRRASDKELSHLVREMFKVVSSTRQDLSAHIESEERVFSEAFPKGDPTAHKLWHEAVLKKEEAKAKFWSEMATSVAKWGILGVISYLVLSGWEHFLREIK